MPPKKTSTAKKGVKKNSGSFFGRVPAGIDDVPTPNTAGEPSTSPYSYEPPAILPETALSPLSEPARSVTQVPVSISEHSPKTAGNDTFPFFGVNAPLRALPLASPPSLPPSHLPNKGPDDVVALHSEWSAPESQSISPGRASDSPRVISVDSQSTGDPPSHRNISRRSSIDDNDHSNHRLPGPNPDYGSLNSGIAAPTLYLTTGTTPAFASPSNTPPFRDIPYAVSPPFRTPERPIPTSFVQKSSTPEPVHRPAAHPSFPLARSNGRYSGFTNPSPIPFTPQPPHPFGRNHNPVFERQEEQDHSGLGEYVKKRRDLLEILSSLHSTGVQKELDLPQIVVVGSQSVGKSSLIESMSGITLPRDSGTCTRCPMECRLQYEKKWSCKISLRFHVDSENRSLADVHEKPFGPTIYHKSDVARALRRAQRAILRPMLDTSLFLDDSDLATPGFPPQSFSANTVCIKIAGPNVPDLYFYDLPGIIANVGDGGNERDIKLVEELAVKYMSRENCIILLVISCETDFENQGAGRLVLKNASLRNRTVGVLTKVDRIEPGTTTKWVNILKNKENALQNGWFCVKQPNARELESGITWEDARDNEDAFFRLQEPWASLESRYRKRMGSVSLADHLSSLLSDLVSQKLPSIQREISKLLNHVERDLQSIPAPNIRDPRREVITIIRDFRKIVSKHIQGLAPDSPDSPPALPGLIHSINQIYEDFKRDIHRTAPRFMPWSLGDDFDSDNSESDEMAKNATMDDIEGTTGRTYYVNEVMDMAKRSRTRELPGNYPFTVTEDIIRSVLRSWSSHASKCFESVKDVLFEQISQLIGIYFGKYSHSGFSDEVSGVFLRTIEEHAVSAREKIDTLYSLEALPFTQNDHYFLSYREKLLKRYKSLYRQSRGQQNLIENLKKYNPDAPPPAPHHTAFQNIILPQHGYMSGIPIQSDNFSSNISTILRCLDQIGIKGCGAEDLMLLLPKDSMDPALEIMAEARAYFQVAFKRFADTVPQQIDAEFLRGFDSSLDIALMYMDLSTDTCLEFLQESPETLKRRQELNGKKRRLEHAREKLKSSGRF